MKEILNQETIQKILGIEGIVPTSPEEMARNLTVTFFHQKDINLEKILKDFLVNL